MNVCVCVIDEIECVYASKREKENSNEKTCGGMGKTGFTKFDERTNIKGINMVIRHDNK